MFSYEFCNGTLNLILNSRYMKGNFSTSKSLRSRSLSPNHIFSHYPVSGTLKKNLKFHLDVLYVSILDNIRVGGMKKPNLNNTLLLPLGI